MGVLVVKGRPLTWAESKDKIKYVRDHGVIQFINTYAKVKEDQNDDLFWGDEVEYGVLEIQGEEGDPDRTVKIALRGTEFMQLLRDREARHAHATAMGCTWHQEYGSWMVEGTPARPYAGYVKDLLDVEENMRLRRARLLAALPKGLIAPTLTNFPLLGVGDFTSPSHPVGGPISESALVPDACINPHPRFGALTQNIRSRRGNKVDIKMPLYRDSNTPEFENVNLQSSSACDITSLVSDRLEKENAAAAADINRARTPPPKGTAGMQTAEPPKASPAMRAAAVVAEAKSEIQRLSDEEDECDDTTGSDAAAETTNGPNGTDGGTERVRNKSGDSLGSGGGGRSGGCGHAYMAPWPKSWPTVDMDCMAFGMGCCCLQVTFQGKDVDDSRYLYDQLAGMSPIMLALTAATPIFKGRLVDTDARWAVISQSVDDRTAAERLCPSGADASADADMAGGGVRPLQKSRYDSISCYLSSETPDMYNDIPCEVDEEMRELVMEATGDHMLARHVAHLFVRDPLVVFEGAVEEVPDEDATDHWENIQSTNWQTMRWKPPPPQDPDHADDGNHIGWRTEFRAMEVQMTDFENAAFSVFIVLLTRVLFVFDLDLVMPLSLVDENMKRAQKIDAVCKEKFFFRKHMVPGHAGQNCNVCDPPATNPPANPPPCSPCSAGDPKATEDGTEDETQLDEEMLDDTVEEMTMDEIFNGKGDYFPGLVPLCYAYLDHMNCDKTAFGKLDGYLRFISARAAAQVKTDAGWMRDFVLTHPEYAKDSVVSPPIAHDLVKACDEVGRGVREAADLLGQTAIDPVLAENAYGSQLARERLKGSCRHLLLCRYKNRANDAASTTTADMDGAMGRRARANSRTNRNGAEAAEAKSDA